MKLESHIPCLLVTQWVSHCHFIICFYVFLVISTPLLATQYTFLGTEDSLFNNSNNWFNQMNPPSFGGITDTIIFSAQSRCVIGSGDVLNGLGYTLINKGEVINKGYFYLKEGNFLNQAQATWENRGEMWLLNILHLENANDGYFKNYAKLTQRVCDFANYGNLMIEDSIYDGIQGAINNYGLLSVSSRFLVGVLQNYSQIENKNGGEIQIYGPGLNRGDLHNFLGSKLEVRNPFQNQGVLQNESDSCIFYHDFRNDSLMNNLSGGHCFILGSNTSGFDNHSLFFNAINATLSFNGFVTNPSDGKMANYGLINNLSSGNFTNNGDFVQEGFLDIPSMGFFNFGQLSGSGTITCQGVRLDGICKPGGIGKRMRIVSSTPNILGDTSSVFIDIDDVLHNDTLTTNQELRIAGTLIVKLAESFIPVRCTDFTILTYTSLNSFQHTFDSLVLPEITNFAWEIEYGQTKVVLHLLPRSSGNNCLDFGTINNHCFVEIPHSLGILQTIEFRFCPLYSNPFQQGQILFSFNHSSSQYIKYLDDNPLMQGETLTLFDANGWLYTDFHFEKSNWYHVAIVSDGISYQKIFVDGNEVSSYILFDYPKVLDVSHMLIGAGVDQSSDSTFFGGQIDEVRLWDRPLSGSFIQQNYFKEIDPLSTGLSAYYPMNQGFANGDNICINQLRDISHQGQDGTLTNFILFGSNCNWSASNTCSVNFPEVNFFTGGSSNLPMDWFQIDNWSAGIPNPCQSVIIPSGKIVELDAAGAACFQIEVEEGGIFLNSATSTLQVLAPNH
ncbi:MAG: LamG domain-containing protein [Saprospiraceae bacterium]|nr:LamG domain-containing protein [Saprospiraceae bacterium]